MLCWPFRSSFSASHSDSLFLTREQIQRLQVGDSLFSAEVRGINIALGDYLASVPGDEPGKAQLDSADAVERAYWKVFWKQVPIADSIVTPTQRALIPMIDSMVRTPEHQRNDNSRYQFGHRVQMVSRRSVPEGRVGVW